MSDFGFYESLDYTKDRIQPEQNHSIVRSFMAHHQGMILTALDNVVNDNVLQSHFHRDLMIRSTELLLQERTPKKVSLSHPRSEETHNVKTEDSDTHPNLRHIDTVNTPYPATQVLSNGSYSVMVTAAGSGFSRSKNIFLSRWNEDLIGHPLGNFIFIEDLSSHRSWSTSFEPMNSEPDAYHTIFSEHKAEFSCQKHDITSHVEVIVSSDDDVEMRKISLINNSSVERTLDITSYLEPILTTHLSDVAHRAFSNLFIETEYISSKEALLANRRKRAPTEDEIWGFHLVTYEGKTRKPFNMKRGETVLLGVQVTYLRL